MISYRKIIIKYKLKKIDYISDKCIFFQNNELILKVYKKKEKNIKIDSEITGRKEFSKISMFLKIGKVIDRGCDWILMNKIQGEPVSKCSDKIKNLFYKEILDSFYVMSKNIKRNIRINSKCFDDIKIPSLKEKALSYDKMYRLYLKKLLKRLLKSAVGSCPCHHDLSPTNVFLQNNQFVLIDFEYFDLHGDLARDFIQCFGQLIIDFFDKNKILTNLRDHIQLIYKFLEKQDKHFVERATCYLARKFLLIGALKKRSLLWDIGTLLSNSIFNIFEILDTILLVDYEKNIKHKIDPSLFNNKLIKYYLNYEKEVSMVFCILYRKLHNKIQPEADFFFENLLKINNFSEYKQNDIFLINNFIYQQTHIDIKSYGINSKYFHYLIETLIGRICRYGVLKGWIFKNFDEYFSKIRNETEEKQFLIDLTSPSTTYFNRDNFTFECIDLLKHFEKPTNNILFLGCATGAEVYSLLFAFLENKIDPSRFGIKAIDINKSAIEFAKQGHYPLPLLRTLPQNIINKYIEYNGEINKKLLGYVKWYDLDIEIFLEKELIKYDLIICRNVLKYLSFNKIKKIINLIEQCASKNAFLIGGHSNDQKDLDVNFTHYSKKIKFHKLTNDFLYIIK